MGFTLRSGLVGIGKENVLVFSKILKSGDHGFVREISNLFALLYTMERIRAYLLASYVRTCTPHVHNAG